MTKEINYNKLIRDKIPQLIEAAGKKYELHKADDKEYLQSLLAKVKEELQEFEEQPSLEEMADIFEVLTALIDYFGFDEEKIREYQEKKRKERGAFKKRLILDKVIE